MLILGTEDSSVPWGENPPGSYFSDKYAEINIIAPPSI